MLLLDLIAQYATRRDEAQTLADSMNQQASDLAQQAGLDLQSLHSAITGLEIGSPWPNVDYPKAIEAKRLYDTQFCELFAVIDWYDRELKNVTV